MYNDREQNKLNLGKMSAILVKSFLFILEFKFKNRVLNIPSEDSGWPCPTQPQCLEVVLVFLSDEAKSVSENHISCLRFTCYLSDLPGTFIKQQIYL